MIDRGWQVIARAGDARVEEADGVTRYVVPDGAGRSLCVETPTPVWGVTDERSAMGLLRRHHPALLNSSMRRAVQVLCWELVPRYNGVIRRRMFGEE